MYKKSIIPIIFLVTMVVAVSGCTFVNNGAPLKNYTGDYLNLTYPSDLILNNDTDGMIILLNTSNSNTQLTIQVLLQQSDLNDNNMIPPISNYTKISSSTPIIDGVAANEITYKTNLLMCSSTYFNKNGKTIIINYQAPINDFNKVNTTYVAIINSIKA